ncbi:right-handed parallel beta-helix repeat-containing protein [candidate division KSB1 bacterium]|nr:right-handed parallel beta-helix repeat-containing protein [candidate division KSB1 bacterium]
MKPKKMISLCLAVFILLALKGFSNTFIVTTTHDFDPGSLRQAIIDANAHTGSDTIVFNIPNTDPGYNAVTGVWTIQPASTFEYLSDDGTCIDGTSQTANQGDSNPEGPEIEIDGTLASSIGFWIFESSANTIRGFVINRCANGIAIHGSGRNIIAGNYIGTDAEGKSDMGNTGNGIYLANGTRHNIIGGQTAADRNVISGNDDTGIVFWSSGTDSNLIIGNYIGTDASGTSAIANGRGFEFGYGPEGNIIGGNDASERNIISGNMEAALYLHHDCRNNIIIGNYIGTDVTGTAIVGNYMGVRLQNGAASNFIGGVNPGEGNLISGMASFGISFNGNGTDSNRVYGNYIGTDATGTAKLPNQSGICLVAEARYNVIGGSSPGERNLISGNEIEGIHIENASHNAVTGNTIGTDVSGTKRLGNNNYGIYITNHSSHNIIGGMTAEEGNLISANGSGVILYGSGNDSNIVQGNQIGTDCSGTGDLGNTNYGIWLSLGPKNNQIGPANSIRFNGKYGVAVFTDSATCNTITRNSITMNGDRGIYNYNGGNTELAPPTIASITDLSVSGMAPPNSIVEIFSDTSDEGAIYEGTTSANASGNFTWMGTPTGPNVTATATDAAGNTSEFSAAFITSVEEKSQSEMPVKFWLDQNYPNPFNPATMIAYQLPRAVEVEINIFNLQGQHIATLVKDHRAAGYHRITWNGADESGQPIANGVYIYRLKASSFMAAKKMLLLR